MGVAPKFKPDRAVNSIPPSVSHAMVLCFLSRSQSMGLAPSIWASTHVHTCPLCKTAVRLAHTCCMQPWHLQECACHHNRRITVSWPGIIFGCRLWHLLPLPGCCITQFNRVRPAHFCHRLPLFAALHRTLVATSTTAALARVPPCTTQCRYKHSLAHPLCLMRLC